jgi:hypothetical protein
MKYRLFSLILTLSLIGWAQETPSTPASPNSTPAAQTEACCHHNAAAQADKAAACCGKNKCEMKDGKSCCNGKAMHAAMKECKKKGSCAEGKCCGDGKGCERSGKNAMECCKSQCEGQPQSPKES